jgi:hypothetical protein
MKKALAILLVLTFAASAKPPEIQVPWSQLDRELARSRIIIATAPGTQIEGEYLGVQGDELRVRTKRGEVAVARAAIQDLRRVEQPRARGRIIGTVSGVVGGLLLGAVLAVIFIGDDSGDAGQAFAIWLGTGAGAGTLGYFLGREFDRKTTRIRLTP